MKNAAGRGDARCRRAEADALLPLPIVLHDGERAGVRGRSTHGRPDRSPLDAAANAAAPQSPHVLLPLILTLSPRREERRGERGRALPPRRGGRPSPSPHRSSRWGEGRGEGQEHARTARLIASVAAVNAAAPQSPHVHLPLTLTLSPRREERRGERGRALPRRRSDALLPLPIVLHDGERVGVRGRSTHGRPDRSPFTRR